MLFNSFSYALFLPIVFCIYWALPQKFKWWLLLVSSYYFYMSWNVKYVILILFTTIISYFAAIFIEKEERKNKKKGILLIAAILCLCVLFVFKYFNFAMDSLSKVTNLLSIQLHTPTLNLLLPVGISFYTFQTLSYVIDVYRGEVEAEHNFGYYATFISFFPQLVAGPIERTYNLLPQIKAEHYFDYESATYGLKRIAWGMFKKICIADVIAVYVDAVYRSLETNTGFPMLVAVLGFTMQIYCDFSGYSDIAIGTAKMLGISLMENFKSPYFSHSVREFWSKWHISLSTWFRDYVYIPLGGSRCGGIRNVFNLMLTFLMSGLWHGANWTFVIWGGIHGGALLLERILYQQIRFLNNKKRLYKLLSWTIVFCFCNLAWVFFRAESVKDALFVISNMFNGISKGRQYLSNSIGLGYWKCIKILFTVFLLALYDFYSKKTDVIVWLSKQKSLIRWTIYIMLVMWIFLFAQIGGNNFLYFQF